MLGVVLAVCVVLLPQTCLVAPQQALASDELHRLSEQGVSKLEDTTVPQRWSFSAIKSADDGDENSDAECGANSTTCHSFVWKRRLGAIIVPVILVLPPFIVTKLLARSGISWHRFVFNYKFRKMKQQTRLEFFVAMLFLSAGISCACSTAVVGRSVHGMKPFRSSVMQFIAASDVLTTTWFLIVMVAQMMGTSPPLMHVLLIETVFLLFSFFGSVAGFTKFNGNNEFCKVHSDEACNLNQTAITALWLTSCLLFCRFVNTTEAVHKLNSTRVTNQQHQRPQTHSVQHHTLNSTVSADSVRSRHSLFDGFAAWAVANDSELSEPPSRETVARAWHRYVDRVTNREFFFNPLLGESVWDQPPSPSHPVHVE